MKIRVLGCHGSQLPHHNTTSFLLEKSILIDAGTVTTVLSLQEQLRIDYVFVTHAHLDHVRDIVFLVDNLYYAKRERPLTVCSSRGIIENLHITYHIKPRYAETIRREVAAIQDRKIHIIEDGQAIRI